MRASLKYGINASSCDAFATYGILLCGPLGQPQEGMKMSKVIDLLLEKQGMDRMKSRCIFICEGMMRKLYMPESRLTPFGQDRVPIEVPRERYGRYLSDATSSLLGRSTHTLFFSLFFDFQLDTSMARH